MKNGMDKIKDDFLRHSLLFASYIGNFRIAGSINLVVKKEHIP